MKLNVLRSTIFLDGMVVTGTGTLLGDGLWLCTRPVRTTKAKLRNNNDANDSVTLVTPNTVFFPPIDCFRSTKTIQNRTSQQSPNLQAIVIEQFCSC